MARVYRRPGSPYYYADWIDAQGTRQQRSTRRKRQRDAQQLADQWERESLRDPRELARARATFRDALDLLEAHLLEQVTAGRMPDATARFHAVKGAVLLRTFTALRPLEAFDAGALRDYVSARRRGVRTLPLPPAALRADAPADARPVVDRTIVKELSTLRLALQLARERGLWAGSLDEIAPAGLATTYKARTRVVTWPEEVDALRRELPVSRWRVVAYALATGAELAAWWRAARSDYDEARALVQIHGTKRATRERAVPVLLAQCKELLAEALAGSDQAPPLLFAPWPNVGRDLKRACRAAGIAAVTPNDLRRSFATWHVEAGVPLDLLYRVMGHVDTTMLARVYGKPDVLRAAELMRDAIARVGKEPKT